MKVLHYLSAGAALALIATAAAQPAAAMQHHMRSMTVHRMAKPMLIPAMQRPTYHGAPGYAGTPGPAVPTLIDFPTTGFFTPAGLIGTGTGIATDIVGGAPALLTGAVGVGTGLTTAVVGAGTGIVGSGVGLIVPPAR